MKLCGNFGEFQDLSVQFFAWSVHLCGEVPRLAIQLPYRSGGAVWKVLGKIVSG